MERSLGGAVVVGALIAVTLMVGNLLHTAFAIVAAGLAALPH